MYAVIRTGGKQYRVAPNDMLQIERLNGAAGDLIEFTDVLMVAHGGEVEIGSPLLAGAAVRGEIAAQERGPRLIIFKKRRRHHYRRRNGHRQDVTSVRITEILAGGAQPEKQAEMPASELAPAAETAPPAEPDDLSLIGGIGPEIGKALGEMGYGSPALIAALTAEDIDGIEAALKMKGRIAREEWVEQARALMAGEPARSKADKSKKTEA